MNKKALLVIDAQNIYTDPDSELYCSDSVETINRINKLIEKFESQKLPVIYVKHIHKMDGSDLGRMFDFAGPEEGFNFKEGLNEVEFDSSLKITNDPIILIKNRYSSFVNTSLNEVLKHYQIDRVVVTGFMTNFCCASTARHAHDLDYFVDFITDATGAPDLTENLRENRIREITAEFLSAGFAVIYSSEDFLNSF